MTDKEVPLPCEGWRRRGGAFTLGRPEWYQCEEPSTVLLHVDGMKAPVPCCNTCWQEVIDTGKQTIISVIPIAPKQESND